MALLWRGRWQVLLLTLSALVAGYIYVKQLVPVYESSSQLYVEKGGPKIIGDSLTIMSVARNYLRTQAKVIRSTPILALVEEQVDREQIETLQGVGDLVGYLKGRLRVSVGDKDDIMTVTCRSSDPEDAAALVNLVTKAYVEFHSRQKQSTADEWIQGLEKVRERRKSDLAGKTNERETFKAAHGLHSLQAGGQNVGSEQYTRLSTSHAGARLATIAAKAELDLGIAALDHMVEGEAPSGEGRGDISAVAGLGPSGVQAEISALESEIELSNLGPEHTYVKSKRRIIDGLREQARQRDREQLEKYLAILRHRYQIALETEEEIERDLQKLQARSLDLSEKVSKYAKLEAEVARDEKAVVDLDDQIKQINFTEDVGPLNIFILEKGRPNRAAVEPQVTSVMTMAGTLGLLFGIFAVFLRAVLDQRLRYVDDIRSTLDLPALADIPAVTDDGAPGHIEKKVHLDPASNVAEAYRMLRTAIFFGEPVERCRTLLVTSPELGDGKSTVVSNLAIAMAQSGQRTLILDSDLRDPSQHRAFNVDNSAGVCSAIVGQTSLDEVIFPTGIDLLELLPLGPVPPNPVEVVNSERFKDMLRTLSSRYDRVLIDSPPLLPVADGRILSAWCDSTLLVLRAGRSTRAVGNHAHEVLLHSGADILGIVLNGVKAQDNGYYFRRTVEAHGNGRNGHSKGAARRWGRKKQRMMLEREAVTNDT